MRKKKLVFYADEEGFGIIVRKKSKNIAENIIFPVNSECNIYFANFNQGEITLTPVMQGNIEMYKVKNDILNIYMEGKSIPMKVNQYGHICETATYNYKDLEKISSFSETHDYTPTSLSRRRMRTCANTKLSSLKK